MKMRGLLVLNLVLVVVVLKAIIVEPHYSMGMASQNNNNETHRCVGHACLVGDEVEENLFSSSDPQGLSAMLASSNNLNIAGSANHAGRQTPDCDPNIHYGASSCLNSPQLNSKTRCDIMNRADYCQRRASQ